MTETRSDILSKRTVFCCCLFFLFFTSLLSQTKGPEKDSLEKKERDSLRVYKRIKYFAYKYKVTSWMYDAVFRDPEPKEYPALPASHEQKNVNPYLKYQSKIIRRINITVYDPFGHSVIDTLPRSTNKIEKLGNRMHITTRRWIIINRLLFKKNDTINALALSETERILRQSVFVNDARIFITEAKNKDSVDVNVIVQDKWPITIPLGLTESSANARFRNQNLFGVGQQFEQEIGFNRPDIFEFKGLYNIANLDNTYISSQLYYSIDRTGSEVGLGFNRAFFSPLSKWAGGANGSRSWKYYEYVRQSDSVAKRVDLNYYLYDFWLGRSFKLSDEKSLFNQSTNILGGIRYYRTAFIERPPFEIDTAYVNQNTEAFIGNVGLAVQQYYKEKYIYRFGANEDVPEGLIVQFIYGTLKKEREKLRYYTGFEIARARHFDFGYLSATFSQGIFFNRFVSNDITTNLKLYFFSDLLRKGNWYFRQFINYNFVHGENKLSKEKLTVSGAELYGYKGSELKGNTKMTLTSETVAYLPYGLIGFKFAPVLMVGVGMLGDQKNSVLRSRLYQSYSLGLMIRNENLLSSTFQFSFGLYPFFPQGGGVQYVLNPVTSFTLRVRLFEFSRPEFISYY